MLLVTAVLGLLASMDPDIKIGRGWSIAASVIRIPAAMVVIAIAGKAPPAAHRWPAVGMWFLGFVVGYPLANGVINGTLFAISAVLR